MTNHLICPADILLPAAGTDMEKWATLACDQFTSQPEYWEKADAFVGAAPSALRLILPEVYLEEPGVEARIEQAHAAMREYLATLLTRSVHGFVYTERTTESGTRRGLLAALDLENYSYAPGAEPLVRPTERTVPERIAPRLAVRQNAALELPHILMLLNDERRAVIEPLADKKAELALLYDTPLMLGGGRAAGWAVTAEDEIARIIAAVDGFAELPGPGGRAPIAIAAGDGNHSLATAKAYWDELKASLPETDRQTHPARFALVELENVYDDAILMEPIHRALFGVTGAQVKQALTEFFGGKLGQTGSQCFTLICAEGDDALALQNPDQPLCVGSIEAFLADFCAKHPAARVDYIHGEAALRGLCAAGAVGFLLPDFDKNDLFLGVYLGGTLPKKTFSMGHAEEKRYYLEARKIVL